MQFRTLFLGCFVFLFSCSDEKKTKVSFESKIEHRIKKTKEEILKESGIITEKPKLTYGETKIRIQKKLSDIQQDSFSADSISSLFTNSLINEIIPYWYNTPWSFEGHTSIPGNGTIACGYFVSTTLEGVGLKINRYKFAQQLPIDEAKSLSLSSEVLMFAGSSSEEIISDMINQLTDGVFFIGFDSSHVGLILKNNEVLFLLHSNYLNNEGVIIEIVEESEVFRFFNKFYIAALSSNRELMERWIFGKKVYVLEGK